MSNSDVSRIVAEIETLAEGRADTDAELDQHQLARMLRGAVGLYANASPDPYGEAALRALDLTPTEACTAAAALLKSQSLTPFEFSIWFSGGRIGGG